SLTFTLPPSIFFAFALVSLFFFFPTTSTPQLYTLSLHDALPISILFAVSTTISFFVTAFPFGRIKFNFSNKVSNFSRSSARKTRSEEHTSELQSRFDLVCRLLLEKKKKKTTHYIVGCMNKDTRIA